MKINIQKTFLRFLVLFLLLVSQLMFGQVSERDSLQIEFYLDKLNEREHKIEGYEEKYFGGTVSYSSDSLLKIFLLEGEARFAYATTAWASYVFYGGQEITSNVSFGSIKKIYTLENKNYLVLEEKEIKISAISHASVVTATWVVVKGDSLVAKSIIDGEEKLVIDYQEYNLDDEDIGEIPFYEYSAKKNILSYRTSHRTEKGETVQLFWTGSKFVHKR